MGGKMKIKAKDLLMFYPEMILLAFKKELKQDSRCDFTYDRTKTKTQILEG
jgi:hypothetical protein